MQFSILQPDFQKAIATVLPAVARRSTLPVLANLHIATGEGSTITLQATDLETVVTVTVDALVEHPGATTVPAKLLADFVSSLPDDSVRAQLNEANECLGLRCLRSDATIHGINVEDWPTVPSFDGGSSFAVEPDVLRNAIRDVLVAVATDDTRPVLTGALLQVRGTTGSFIATDGFRMVIRRVAILDTTDDLDVIIPSRALQMLRRLMAQTDEPVEITVAASKNLLRCHAGPVSLVTRLLDGHFPDYARIIPASHTTRVVVDRQGCLNATQQAAVVAALASKLVVITCQPGNDIDTGTLTLASRAAEAGDSRAELSANVTGDPMTINLNSAYLRDAITSFESASIAIDLQTSASPALLRRLDGDDYIHLIMPMSGATT